VQLLGTRTDHLGRAGLAIAFTSHGAMDELIFDRRTSAFLGENEISPSGQLTGWAAYLTSRIVNGIPGRAPGPLSPPCQNGGGYAHTAPGGATIMTGAPSGS